MTQKILKYKYIILALIFIFNACRQKDGQVTQRLFKKYEGKQDVYLFDIQPNLISAFIDDDTEKNKELKTALENLDNIYILLFRTYNKKVERKNILFNKFNEYYSENNYNNLVIINQYNEKVVLKYNEKVNEQDELIILLTDNDSFVTLSMIGKFDYYTLTTLLKIDNIETLKEMKDK